MRRILFIGDTLMTEGPGDLPVWVDFLSDAERRDGTGFASYALGHEGYTTKELAKGWKREARRHTLGALRCGLVFQFGVDDMASDPDRGVRLPLPQSLAAAEDMVGAASEWKPTLWLGPTPVKCGTVRNELLAALSNVYASAAERIGVPYLDLFDLLSRDAQWLYALERSDGLHANALGQERVAELVHDWQPWRRWFKPAVFPKTGSSLVRRLAV